MCMLYKVEDVLKENSFYDRLKCEWDMHYAGDLVMCLVVFNGQIDRHID